MKQLLFVVLSMSLIFLGSKPSWALDAQKRIITSLEMGSS